MSRFSNPTARTVALVLSLLMSLSLTTAAAEKKTDENFKNVIKALKGGGYGITLRYRYEHVTADLSPKDADASTLRSTLWYESAGFHEIRGYLQFEDVSNLGLADDHNDGQNGVIDRPRILDPPATEVHQANLSYRGLKNTEFVLGRREITLDDQRYIGNVAWRQNYQSFDTFYLTQKSIPRTEVTYAYLNNVKTILATNVSTSSHLFNFDVDLKKFGSVVPYYYYLDFDSTAMMPLSTATLGASWQGKAKVGKFMLPYRLELARQTDAGSNPNSVDADYLRAVIGLARGRWSAKLGYELLGGSPADGRFTTPLATLFKFNGWADQFVLTPANGLVDLYAVGTYAWSRYSAILAVHRFDADTGGGHYGDEIDFRFIYTAPWKQRFAIQFALFNAADAPYADVKKLWIMTDYTF